ncbi:class I SAM-dependent methyltransferase [Salinisphaera sp. P385]|uniref:Class I SAM-dependent methyltransferase n=1 Tax=Spectribacter acetivorans TaxID=3075603 RepID=A0ABU3B6D1_9GAMM|nr:class I SAM-dependent methyltransferase [Salinisphaera sp. P385]MDT0618008.1 class I SAM-dependent methyltransferase [Salinisphaera sp. P385]
MIGPPGEADWPADIACGLCGHTCTRGFARVASGRYGRCPECDLIFQHPDERPDALTEHRLYSAHDNRVDDPGYRAFLQRLTDRLIPQLSPGACGLDYGAGPGPALAAMLDQAGFPTAVYDPFFAPDTAVLARRYDFVVCTETAEHFHHPGAAFDQIAGLLQPAGCLGLMTRLFDAGTDFATWHYHRDPTHVSFYTESALDWLAARHGWRWRRYGADVVILRQA